MSQTVEARVERSEHLATLASRAHRLNLGPADVYILALLGGHLAGTASDIVNLDVIQRQAVYRHVAGLVLRGYIRQERNTIDKRRVHLFMTESGRSVAERLVDALTGGTR